MKTYLPAILVLLVCASFFYLYHLEQSKYRDLEDAKYKYSIDSIRTNYMEIIHEDSVTFVLYQKAIHDKFKAEAEANIWRKRYEKQRAVIIRFSDSELDSILLTIR